MKKIYNALINIFIGILITIAFLLSLSVSFLAFILIITATKYSITIVDISYTGATALAIVFGSLTISGIIFWETVKYLNRFITLWESVVKNEKQIL